VRLTGPEGKREIPLSDLYSGDGRKPHALGRSEIVTAVVIPGASASGRSHYEKLSLRGSIDFPVVGAAVWKGDGGVAAAFTGVDRAPIRASELEAELRGGKLTEASLRRAASLAPKAARIAPTSVHSVSFKRELMAALFLKAMRAIA
jgi:4-hydroxybenzoyl-CoA reductase subunit beta